MPKRDIISVQIWYTIVKEILENNYAIKRITKTKKYKSSKLGNGFGDYAKHHQPI